MLAAAILFGIATHANWKGARDYGSRWLPQFNHTPAHWRGDSGLPAKDFRFASTGVNLAAKTAIIAAIAAPSARESGYPAPPQVPDHTRQSDSSGCPLLGTVIASRQLCDFPLTESRASFTRTGPL